MDKKIRYRFKTKKEFIDEFGDDWRSIVPRKFPDWMDYLLGKEIDLTDHNLIYATYGRSDIVNCDGELDVSSFSIRALNSALNYTSDLKISKEMLTIISDIPTYEPKKFIYE